MTSNVLGDRLEEVLATVLAEVEGPAYVTDPSPTVIEAVVDALGDVADPPPVRMLAADRAAKTAFGDFLVAGAAADLVGAGTLSVRTTDDRALDSTIVAGDEVFAIVDGGSVVGGLGADEPSFVEATRSRVETAWSEAEDHSLRTPALSEVRERLGDDLDPGVEEDFAGMLESLETARGDDTDLDEVTVSLLAAARNDALLYDVSRWGEDTGVASKATFSRTKTRLEEQGLVETEKVPIDVGRPRLRLTLADDRLREADPDQVVAAAQSVLN